MHFTTAVLIGLAVLEQITVVKAFSAGWQNAGTSRYSSSLFETSINLDNNLGMSIDDDIDNSKHLDVSNLVRSVNYFISRECNYNWYVLTINV